eukprot:scaffold72265_cov47-Prasinocladus_malaysianus.AAC.1
MASKFVISSSTDRVSAVVDILGKLPIQTSDPIQHRRQTTGPGRDEERVAGGNCRQRPRS